MNLELLNEIDSFVWGPPLLVLLVGTGVFLSLRLGFLQVARLPKALGLIFKAKSQGEGERQRARAKGILRLSGRCAQLLPLPSAPVILSAWLRP